MQEQQVTVEGQTFPLPRPFHVLATANPVEYEGTYPLPEAQLDRFLVRVAFGYPDADGEWEVLGRRMARRREEQEVRRVVDAAELLDLQATMEDVTVSPEVGRYCVALTRATRDHEHTLMGASPRGLARPHARGPGVCRASGAATTSPPTTSRPWRPRCSSTASSCGPSCG